MVFNLDLEKHLLAGLIKHPDFFVEIESFIGPDDFGYDINRIIFTIIQQTLYSHNSIDASIIIAKLQNLGISFKDNLDTTEYVNALALLQVSLNSLRQTVQELKKITFRRNYIAASENIKRSLLKAGNKSMEELISIVDKEHYENLEKWFNASDSIDLFETMFDRAFRLAESPIDEMGYKTPHAIFNSAYGGFLPGNIYVFCARPKMGKTTFLNSTAFKMANMTSNIPCLILDTEMQENEIGDRILAMTSGVPLWYIRTGNFGKNAELTKKIKETQALARTNKWSMHHEYVINCPIDRVINKIKRWYYTKVGRGNPCIIVYDYIKLTGESLSDHYKEHQAVGDKVNRLKELVGKEVTGTLLTSLQLNRSGESGDGSKGVTDDSSAISLSDRALWFASYVGIFRRKTLKEIEVETEKFGTHKLITIESRWQGKSSFGHHSFILNEQGKPTRNFINFQVENFDATEVGDAQDMYSQLRLVSDKSPKDKPTVKSPFGPDDDTTTTGKDK